MQYLSNQLGLFIHLGRSCLGWGALADRGEGGGGSGGGGGG